MSKARRKGSGIEVSGEDTYKALTLPLLKAAEHLQRTGAVTAHYSDGRVVIPVAVIRGPMVAVLGDGEAGLEAQPWVRVQRYEPEVNSKSWRSHRLLAYDVVHEDFLETYLDMVMDYADEVANAIAQNQEVLLTGRGFAAGLGSKVGYPVAVTPMKAEARARARHARMDRLQNLVQEAWASISQRVPSARPDRRE